MRPSSLFSSFHKFFFLSLFTHSSVYHTHTEAHTNSIIQKRKSNILLICIVNRYQCHTWHTISSWSGHPLALYIWDDHTCVFSTNFPDIYMTCIRQFWTKATLYWNVLSCQFRFGIASSHHNHRSVNEIVFSLCVCVCVFIFFISRIDFLFQGVWAGECAEILTNNISTKCFPKSFRSNWKKIKKKKIRKNKSFALIVWISERKICLDVAPAYPWLPLLLFFKSF